MDLFSSANKVVSNLNDEVRSRFVIRAEKPHYDQMRSTANEEFSEGIDSTLQMYQYIMICLDAMICLATGEILPAVGMVVTILIGKLFSRTKLAVTVYDFISSDSMVGKLASIAKLWFITNISSSDMVDLLSMVITASHALVEAILLKRRFNTMKILNVVESGRAIVKGIRTGILVAREIMMIFAKNTFRLSLKEAEKYLSSSIEKKWRKT